MKGRFPLSSCALVISGLFASHTALAETPTYSASERAVTTAKETIIVDGHIDVPYRVKEKWVDVTRRETMEGAEAAIEGSVEHFSKKIEYIKGPKVVKTFK